MARQSGMRAVRSGRVGLQALDDGEVLAGGVAGPLQLPVLASRSTAGAPVLLIAGQYKLDHQHHVL
jgi:hypothetical protein